MSIREYNLTILTWSKINNHIYNLYLNYNMPIHSLYLDKGFTRVWLCIKISYHNTLLFPLNTCQLREIYIMKKITDKIE